MQRYEDLIMELIEGSTPKQKYENLLKLKQTLLSAQTELIQLQKYISALEE